MSTFSPPSRMSWRISIAPTWVLCAIVLSSCGPRVPYVKVEEVTWGHPQEVIRGTGAGEGFWAVADRRVFAVTAFLNAAGVDEEAPGCQMHPLRTKVREKVAANLAAFPDKLKSWREYFSAKGHYWGQYVDWALTLNTDHPFRRVRPDEELGFPWTSYILADLPDILNDFWVTARLDSVWRECWPDYAAELARYNPAAMAEEMSFLWRYMRMARKDRMIIVQLPNPLVRHHYAFASRHGDYYLSVNSPGTADGLNVHEYLHSFINDLVKGGYSAQEVKLRKYFEAGKDAPISSGYQDPVLWTCECLVHALDHRLAVLRISDPVNRKIVEDRVAAFTSGGYTLLGPLYASLARYEQSQLSFDRYFPILLEELPEYSR